ncbi:hypothetical protein V8C35DRAFT_279137 [Trichoderma chlorosporum]
MQFSTAAFALLSLALAVSADDNTICFPLEGQKPIPQSIAALPAQTKIDWATKLCSPVDFSDVDSQPQTTDLADGVVATEDGKTYGLNLITVAAPDLDSCVSHAEALFDGPCPTGGAFINLDSFEEEYYTIVALN